MDRESMAENNFRQGYNCTQAVVMAFSDLTDVEEGALKRLSVDFGAGFARTRATCGAVSGMLIMNGLLTADETPKAKVAQYPIARGMMEKFKEVFSSTICGELMANVPHTEGSTPEPRTEEYYKKRPCISCIRTAARILCERLKEVGIIDENNEKI